jgi:hypothetical protein
MIGLFKELFKSADSGYGPETDQKYDRLMESLGEDEILLLGIENEVHEGISQIEREVQSVSREVDETLGKTTD